MCIFPCVCVCLCVPVCVRVLPLGVVDAGSSQDDADSRCAAVQVVNSQSFFVCGSTDHKHNDVLRSATHTHTHTIQENTQTHKHVCYSEKHCIRLVWIQFESVCSVSKISEPTFYCHHTFVLKGATEMCVRYLSVRCVCVWVTCLSGVCVTYLSLRLLAPRYGNWLSLSRLLINWSRVSWSRGWCWVYTFSTPWTVTHQHSHTSTQKNTHRLLSTETAMSWLNQETTCVQRLLETWATCCRNWPDLQKCPLQ